MKRIDEDEYRRLLVTNCNQLINVTRTVNERLRNAGSGQGRISWKCWRK